MRPTHAVSILIALTSWLSGPGVHAAPELSPEVLHRRNYFYVGGHYENLTENTYTPGQVLVDQMYVEELIPMTIRKETPIVFWSGDFQTGTNWLNTPDGRRGWASSFLDAGYVVYLVDQPQRGRSAQLPAGALNNASTAGFAERFFTAPQKFNLWPQAKFHTQWPGSGVRGDAVFDEFYASQVQALHNSSTSEAINRAAGAALLQRLGCPAIIVTHSQAGPFGWGLADTLPEKVRGVLAIEPTGPPFQEQVLSEVFDRPYGITVLPLTYDPPISNPSELRTVTLPPAGPDLSACVLQQAPPRKLSNIARVPVRMISSEASYHAPYDYCTVEYLRQAGVPVDWIHLPAVGIHGNGHFVFLEKNSHEVFKYALDWANSLS